METLKSLNNERDPPRFNEVTHRIVAAMAGTTMHHRWVMLDFGHGDARHRLYPASSMPQCMQKRAPPRGRAWPHPEQ